MVFWEVKTVVQRLNAQAGTNALLLRMALSTMPNERVKPSATKSQLKAFNDMITDLIEGK